MRDLLPTPLILMIWSGLMVGFGYVANGGLAGVSLYFMLGAVLLAYIAGASLE